MSVIDEGSQRSDFRWSSPKIIILVAAVAVFGGLYLYWHSHRGLIDHSAAAQAASGADVCSSSGYWITTAAAGKEIVYDCLIGSKAVCVTYKDGIATDSTVLVKAVFANTLGANKPECVTTSS